MRLAALVLVLILLAACAHTSPGEASDLLTCASVANLIEHQPASTETAANVIAFGKQAGDPILRAAVAAIEAAAARADQQGMSDGLAAMVSECRHAGMLGQ